MSTELSSPLADALQPALSALGDAENRMREAAAKAATDGAYESLVVIARWAKTLQGLLTEVNGFKNAEAPQGAHDGSSPAGSQVATLRSDEGGGQSKRILPGVSIFSRDADFLVKHARSRKTRDAYEHRAPAEVLFGVAECLAEWRPTKKLLTADQLLQAYSKRKGKVVAYQVYVALGWLTQMKLVRRHGRSGYSIPSPSTIANDVREAWAAFGPGELA